MKTAYLDEDNLIEEIVRYGFFTEQFPSCFSTEEFADYANSLADLISLNENSLRAEKATQPSNLAIFKNDVARRILSAPNPKAFLTLVKFIAANWNMIKDFSKSENSLSPITVMHNYDYGMVEVLNCELARKSLRKRSDYTAGIKKCIGVSMGKMYRLKVDISNCYGSMYTHAISWAVCGKVEAKRFVKDGKKSWSKEYAFANSFDTYMRFQKYNETNGILIGPYTSRIFSEVILAKVDKILRKQGFVFKRYVDDYKFYFSTEAEAQLHLPKIERILNEFNLSLNAEKTEIAKFPFESISAMKSSLEKAHESNDVFGVLNQAAIMYQSGEKGAFKYALKFIEKKELNMDDKNVIIPFLINLMLLDPRLGNYVANYIKRHLAAIKSDGLAEVFNKQLSRCLDADLEQESSLFLHLINEFDLYINAENLLKAFKSGNDFIIIIALDIWNNRRGSVKGIEGKIDENINNEIVRLLNDLKGETMKGSRWLLLYELNAGNLVEKSKTPNISDEFFRKMLKWGVRFYHSSNF